MKKNNIILALSAATAIGLAAEKSDARLPQADMSDAQMIEDYEKRIAAHKERDNELSRLLGESRKRVNSVIDERNSMIWTSAAVSAAVIAMAIVALNALNKMGKMAKMSQGQIDETNEVRIEVATARNETSSVRDLIDRQIRDFGIQKSDLIKRIEEKDYEIRELMCSQNINQNNRVQANAARIKKLCLDAGNALRILVSKFSVDDRAYLLPLINNLEVMENLIGDGKLSEAEVAANKILGAIEFIESGNEGAEEEDEESNGPVSDRGKVWNDYVNSRRVKSDWLDDSGRLIDFFGHLEIPFQETWSHNLASQVNKSFRKSVGKHRLHPDQLDGVSENEKKYREKIFIILGTAKQVFEDENAFGQYVAAYQTFKKIYN